MAAQPDLQHAAFGEPLSRRDTQSAARVSGVFGIGAAGSEVEQAVSNLAQVPLDLVPHRHDSHDASLSRGRADQLGFRVEPCVRGL